MPSPPALFDLTPTTGDLAEIDALRRAIDWGPGSWFLGPMMESGGRILGARDPAGWLVAMGGAAVFAPAGFICNMVVRPDWKRRGLGRHVFEQLLEWLESCGHTQVQLEATEEGRPLYEQYGFRTRWESLASTLINPPARGDEAGVDDLEADLWPAVEALDRRATGMNRGPLLRLLAGQPNFIEGLVVRSAGGVEGYGMRFQGRIGPLVASTEAAAATLARGLASRSEPGTLATVGHPSHASVWTSLGFEVTPFDVRMARGSEPADDPSMVYCMLNGGAG